MAASNFNTSASVGAGATNLDNNQKMQQPMQQNASANKSSGDANYKPAPAGGMAANARNPRLDPDYYKQSRCGQFWMDVKYEDEKHEALDVY